MNINKNKLENTITSITVHEIPERLLNPVLSMPN